METGFYEREIFLIRIQIFRANTDILLGKNCGLQTLLVGSGVHSLAETRQWEESGDQETRRMVADYYVDKLGDLCDRVRQL